MEEVNIINKCQKFLERVSSRYSNEITEQERALEIAGGKFWDEDTKKRWAIYNKDDPEHDLVPTISFNNISAQVNAIASPFSKSPFHINIIDRGNDDNFGLSLQDKITQFEGSNIVKNIYNRAFTRGVTCAAGYVIIGTQALSDGSLVPNIEFASNQSIVAFDPDCETPDGSDAEEGAIVSYISIKKARREFGEGVVPLDYPTSQPELSFNSIQTWNDKSNKIQLVRYFTKEKNAEGNTIVNAYTICGNYVSEPTPIPTSIIPIVRFAGYNDYDSSYGLVYTGYVQKMMPNIEMMSLALTMQAQRMRRCSNVRIIAGKKATAGCEGYFEDFEKSASMVLEWNDAPNVAPPQIVQDNFQTGDISNVISMTRQAMMDESGVNLAGIDTQARTAYEVMQQQTNSESNVQELYLNAEAACHTLAKIVLSILNNGVVPAFTLEGGPSVITKQMKERAELQAIQPLVPPEQLPLLAIRMAETIDSEMGKNLAQDIKANTQLQFTEGQDIGAAMSQLSQMKNVLDQTMQQLEQTQQQMAELQKENESLNIAMQNQEWQHRFDMLKWQTDVKHNEAQLAIDNASEAHKLKQEDAKILMQANSAKVKNDVDMKREELKLQSDLAKYENEQRKIQLEIEKQNRQAQLEAERAERERQRENMKFDLEQRRADAKASLTYI